jgi:hypothetical protein
LLLVVDRSSLVAGSVGLRVVVVGLLVLGDGGIRGLRIVLGGRAGERRDSSGPAAEMSSAVDVVLFSPSVVVTSAGRSLAPSLFWTASCSLLSESFTTVSFGGAVLAAETCSAATGDIFAARADFASDAESVVPSSVVAIAISQLIRSRPASVSSKSPRQPAGTAVHELAPD